MKILSLLARDFPLTLMNLPLSLHVVLQHPLVIVSLMLFTTWASGVLPIQPRLGLRARSAYRGGARLVLRRGRFLHGFTGPGKSKRAMQNAASMQSTHSA